MDTGGRISKRGFNYNYIFIPMVIVLIFICSKTLPPSNKEILTSFQLNVPSEQKSTLYCPEHPSGNQELRKDKIDGSPVLFLIPTEGHQIEFRRIWRSYLFPHMASLNMDAVFLIEKQKQTANDTAEALDFGDIQFYDVPKYNAPLWGFYYRAVEGYRLGLNQKKKKYEWFIRPDSDAFYCLHHIRLELNALDAKKRPEGKPGIHWAHFYGDGAGGQAGVPVSDVHEILNRYAAEEGLKYAKQAMVNETWDLATVHVYGSNIVDLSPNVTQIRDIRWAYGPGVKGETFWNSGFLGYEFANQDCLCANWLAVHLGKKGISSRFKQLSSIATASQNRNIEFNQPMPRGTKFGHSAPYFKVGGCPKDSDREWPGCA